MIFETDIWYLVKTKPRMEEMAEINLNNQPWLIQYKYASLYILYHLLLIYSWFILTILKWQYYLNPAGGEGIGSFLF